MHGTGLPVEGVSRRKSVQVCVSWARRMDAGVWTGPGAASRWRWLSVRCWGWEKPEARLSWWPVELQEGSAGGTPSDLTGAAEPELQERARGNFFEHSDGDTPAGSRWMARPRREFWGSRAFRKCSNGAELGLPGLGRARSLWRDF